jgi:hypothetical protein
MIPSTEYQKSFHPSNFIRIFVTLMCFMPDTLQTSTLASRFAINIYNLQYTAYIWPVIIVRPCILNVGYVFLLFVHEFLTLAMYSYCFLCILNVSYVFLLLSMYSYCCLCILNVGYVLLLLSMYSYCCLCILNVGYVFLLLSMYS